MMTQSMKKITIYEVANLEASLAEVIEHSQPLDLDLGDLEEVDTAGIQWLLSLKQRKEQQRSTLTLSQVPNSVTEVFGLLGVSSLVSTATQDSRDA